MLVHFPVCFFTIVSVRIMPGGTPRRGAAASAALELRMSVCAGNSELRAGGRLAVGDRPGLPSVESVRFCFGLALPAAVLLAASVAQNIHAPAEDAQRLTSAPGWHLSAIPLQFPRLTADFVCESRAEIESCTLTVICAVSSQLAG
jgi:hypothetical protein